jgi:1,4-dihydroxy-2-naphthoyl-CoA synthase
MQAAAAPLNDLQQESVHHADSVNAALPAKFKVAKPAIMQASDAAVYVKQVADAAVASSRGVA